MGVFATAKSPSAKILKSTASDKLELNMNTEDAPSDEREEGEIIDEYEDIISSDEEFSMRQRIEELEAKNAELEKIENISGVYGNGNYEYTKKDACTHQTDRYPLISINISDEEDYPPAPQMTRISKRRKSLQHSCSRRKLLHSSSSSYRRRKQSSSPPPAPQYRPCDKILLSMFHDRVATHTSYSSKRKRKSKKSHSTKTSRKSREYYISDSDSDYYFDNYHVDVNDSYANFNSSDADKSYFLNRDELRVALARNPHRIEQHVSLKDRLIRRKENTDTLNEKPTQDSQEIVEEETKPDSSLETEDNLEEQELRIIALKSAVIRKHLVRKKRNENVAYSPSDFEGIYANATLSPSINNIDDAEACMEISPVPSPKMIVSDDEGMDTKPIDMDIANSDSDCELPSYEQWVPIEQIPLPNSMGMVGELYVPTPLRYNDGEEKDIPHEVRFESVSVSPANLDSEVEEEELALRALLLAKMNSPKVNKIVKEERPKVDDLYAADRDTSMEAEALRHFLINNMKKKAQSTNSSASVLKEAVRRLTARNSSRSPADSFAEISSSKVKLESVSRSAEESDVNLGQSITDMANLKIQVQREPEEIVKREEFLHEVTKDAECGATSENKIMEKVGEDVVDSMLKKKAEAASKDNVGPKVIVKEEILGVLDVNRGEGDPNNILSKKSTKLDGAPVHEIETTEHPHHLEKAFKPTSKSDNLVEAQLHADEVECDRVVEQPIVLSKLSVPECVIVKKEESSRNEEQKHNSIQEVVKNEYTFQLPASEDIIEDILTLQGDSSCVAVPQESIQKVDSKSSVGELSTQIRLENEEETSVLLAQKTNGQEKPFENKSVAPIPEKKKNPIPVVQQVVCPSVIGKHVSLESNLKLTVESITRPNDIELRSVDQDYTAENKTNLNNHAADKVVSEANVQLIKPNTKLTPKKPPSAIEIKEKPNRAVSKKPQNIPSERIISGPIVKMSAQSSTTLRTKIVKPNKVINQQTTDLKRKPSDYLTKTAIPTKKAKVDDTTNRLITAAEVPQVKKLIIQLRASDTESEYSAMSADDYDYDGREDARVGSFINRNITIGNEYYDIASPISLPMESPYDTPTRVASPIANITPIPEPSVEKSIVNDFFEAKLDQFLKNVRSKVADSSKTPMEYDVSTAAPLNTPVAVRHLPEASQHEYRRLINRMKLLERQKQAKNLQVIVKSEDSSIAGDSGRVMIEADSKTLVRKVLVKNASANNAKPTSNKKTADVKPSSKHVPQNTNAPEIISKHVPLSSAKTKSALSPQKSTLSPPKSVPVLKPSKENLLDLYENSYRKTGTSIISNLDKSIELVLLAKEAKMAKFKYEHRLREIRKEMEEVQRNLQQQQERITKIYPDICGSHRMIESLKARRVKINKAVTALGKSVIGPEYSMNDDQKSTISEKCKKLAAEIKFVNSMKLSDVEKWERLNCGNLPDNATVVAPPKDFNGLTLEPSPAMKNELYMPPSVQKVPLSDSVNSPKTIAVDVSVPEATQKMESKLNDTIVPETESNEEKQKDTTSGQEEALITMPVYDKEALDPQKMGEAHKEEKVQVGGAKLQDYVSPLSHLRDERQINPNGIVCPYQLMGQCDDKDCKYMHLDNDDDSSNILEEVEQNNKETA